MKIRISMFAFLLLLVGCQQEVKMKKSITMDNKTDFKKDKKLKNNKYNISAAQAKEMLAQNPDIKVLDVRRPDETKDGIFEGAIEINYEADDFEEKISKLNKEDSYIVYCRSGGRSAKAAQYMRNNGMTSYNMKEGYAAFIK